MVHGGGTVGGDDDALAGGQAVVLDHVWRSEAVKGRRQFPLRGARDRLGGGHARGRHDVLGKGLGALEAGGLGSGAEDGDAGLAHSVGHARHERGLRTDDDEVGIHLSSKLNDLHRTGRVDGEIGGDRSGPRITGSDDEFTGGWGGGEATSQGVLSRACTEKQDLHVSTLPGCPSTCALSSSTRFMQRAHRDRSSSAPRSVVLRTEIGSVAGRNRPANMHDSRRHTLTATHAGKHTKHLSLTPARCAYATHLQD